MKKLQQLFASVVLTLLLSVSALAGDGIIIIMKTDPPPPPPSVATKNAVEAEGIMTTGRAATDPVTEIVLGLLPSVLALF
ncbi:MAG: hypothetical protein QOD32_625 [Pyrinomonadaceae bacterium]|nr:hypothetical protein [Pyrinomonadaceae bacterium]